MLVLSRSRLLRLLTFGALYFAQGVPSGFITVGYVIFLTDQGLSNEAVSSAIGLMSLPWALKIVWAPLLDRVAATRFGRRRPFIIAAELAMGLTLLSLLFLDPKRDLSLIGAVLVLHSAFTSLQDTAVDGMAVDLLQAKEQATANGVMWASKTFGMAVGGAGGVFLAKRLGGWPALIITITIVLWAVMLLMILVRERPPGEVTPDRGRAKWTLANLKRSFAFSTPLVGLAIGALTPLGILLVLVVYTRYLRADLKLPEETIGSLQGIIEPAAGVAGALAGGVLADRLGVRKVIAAQMVGLSATLAAFAVAPDLRANYNFLVALSIASSFFFSAYTAAIIGFFMRLSNPAIGATQFTIYTGAVNIAAASAAILGGKIADAYGVTALFGLAATIQVAFIALLPFCDPRVAQARFSAGSTQAEPSSAAP